MATVWEDFLSAIRADIQDTGETPKYSDEMLFVYLGDALNDYSMWFPLRVDHTELKGSGTGPYALPDDYIADLLVECPEDRFLERRGPRPGIRYPTQSGKPFFYYTQGGSLYLNSSPYDADGVFLTYESLHPTPTAWNDAETEFTVPVKDRELLRIFIKAKIMESVRTKQAALDRFKSRFESGSDRQDNPLLPEVEELYADYYRKISARRGGGTVLLYRSGRHR